MRHFLPIFYICLGIFLGYFLSRLESIQSNPTDHNISVLKSDPMMAENGNDGKSATQKVCPVCPCLFSDEILGPPRWDPKLKENLETNHEGEVLVRWLEVPGAKRYNVYVENEIGKVVKTFKASRTLVYVKDIPLPEGKFEADYFLRLSTMNGKDEEGSKTDRRSLRVRPQANVVAPAIQEIKVED